MRLTALNDNVRCLSVTDVDGADVNFQSVS